MVLLVVHHHDADRSVRLERDVQHVHRSERMRLLSRRLRRLHLRIIERPIGGIVQRLGVALERVHVVTAARSLRVLRHVLGMHGRIGLRLLLGHLRLRERIVGRTFERIVQRLGVVLERLLDDTAAASARSLRERIHLRRLHLFERLRLV